MFQIDGILWWLLFLHIVNRETPGLYYGELESCQTLITYESLKFVDYVNLMLSIGLELV